MWDAKRTQEEVSTTKTIEEAIQTEVEEYDKIILLSNPDVYGSFVTIDKTTPWGSEDEQVTPIATTKKTGYVVLSSSSLS